uniref:MoaD/ThiS family protein n=1 Tax=Buteo japonicus TaxID=224669 RepID=A0A8C0BLP4_9AVES
FSLPSESVLLYFAHLSGIYLSCPRLCTSLLFNEISWLNANTLFRNLFVLLPTPLRLEYVLLGDQLLVLQPRDKVAIIPPISGG